MEAVSEEEMEEKGKDEKEIDEKEKVEKVEEIEEVEAEAVVEEKKEEEKVFRRSCVCWATLVGRGLTVHPADADGLAEGEQQQRGAAADVMVEQLQQVHSSLPADRHTQTHRQTCFSQMWTFSPGQGQFWVGPLTSVTRENPSRQQVQQMASSTSSRRRPWRR